MPTIRFFTALLRVSSEEMELWGVIYPMSNGFFGAISFFYEIGRRRLAGAILDKKHYLFLKAAGRFSIKAAMPSFWSWVAKAA